MRTPTNKRMLFLLYVLFLTGADAQEKKLDFSGSDFFFAHIYQPLLKDIEPDKTSWDTLFNTPGYAALQAREKKRSVLINAFRLAFKPSMTQVRDSVQQSGSYLSFLLKHLTRFPAHEQKVMEFQKAFRDTFSLSHALSVISGLIPDTNIHSVAPPPVSFLLFAADGRGYADRIIVDIFHLTEEPDISLFFAHELFHFFFHRIRRNAFKEDSLMEPVFNRLYYLYEEGMADMNDKRMIPFMSDAQFAGNATDNEYLIKYRAVYNNGIPGTISYMDSVINILSKGKGDARLAGAFNQMVPMEGRPVGAYMANAILSVKGVAAYHEALEDIYKFYKYYNDAAILTGRPVFSQEALTFIKDNLTENLP